MSFSHTFTQDKPVFMSDEDIQEALAEMVQDEYMDTSEDYKVDLDGSRSPIAFIEKHTNYLKTHPKTNPQNYLANVKTMIRIRH